MQSQQRLTKRGVVKQNYNQMKLTDYSHTWKFALHPLGAEM